MPPKRRPAAAATTAAPPVQRRDTTAAGLEHQCYSLLTAYSSSKPGGKRCGGLAVPALRRVHPRLRLTPVDVLGAGTCLTLAVVASKITALSKLCRRMAAGGLRSPAFQSMAGGGAVAAEPGAPQASARVAAPDPQAHRLATLHVGPCAGTRRGSSCSSCARRHRRPTCRCATRCALSSVWGGGQAPKSAGSGVGTAAPTLHFCKVDLCCCSSISC